ncbi:30S ribosomal protein S20 [Candidatus Babeliales bacterium]|nr:30S ribosomal protein S20 [Candidatus Babeliales bacterium]
MANIKSAKKRARQNTKRRSVNVARRSAIKSVIKDVVKAIDAGEIEKAQALFKVAETQLSRAKSKGLVHKKTASRKVSRLARRVNKAQK